jgi:hypothetical protein
MHAHLKNLAVLGLVAGLSACAGDAGRYPSLALRPFEINGAPAPAPPAPTPIRSPEQVADLAALVRRADAAHTEFARAQTLAQPLARAARGLSPESDARASALVAMADLTVKRGATSAVLADLDAIAIDTATKLAPDPATEAARAKVAALLASEDAELAQLWEAMGS